MSVVTKNPYDLLGTEDDDAGSQTTASKGGQSEAPKPTQRRGGMNSNDAAFRDRNAGRDANRSKPTDDSPRGHRGGYHARVRGGRGSGHPRNRDDRHSKHVPSGGSEKQAAQSWGAAEGQAELKDEQAGEEQAQAEKKEDAEEGETKEVEPAEPEEKQISYADYLAQQAEKKLSLEGDVHIRKPNEGSKVDKKWASAKALPTKEDKGEEGEFKGGKSKRERERKQKQVLELENRYVEPERGNRGRGRGGGPRRGGRGDRGGRGSGDYRPRGDRFGGQSNRNAAATAAINTDDQSAFPSLGS